MLAALRTVVAEAAGHVLFFDLHSTSGPGAPFSVAPDLLRNRHLAATLPVPTVLGLEESIDGTLLGYLCDQGHLGLAIEGGQHEAPETAPLLQACLWFGMATAGMVNGDHVPGREAKLERLRKAARGKPPLVAIKHRHGVAADDGFAMRPGYRNFTPVQQGEVVAHDKRGPLTAPRSGLMMLPRYQPQGDDGFFVATVITPRWLRLSSAARRIRLDQLLPLLPGVTRRDAARLHYSGDAIPNHVVELLHLLGYRGVRPETPGLELFRRRRR